MATEYQQVNTNIDTETIGLLDTMTREDGDVSRSAFFRRLIRQEYARRFSQPNALITIAEAQAAAGRVMNDGTPHRGDHQGF